MASTPGTISLYVENEVIHTTEVKTLFGVWGDQSGWLWDRRIVSLEGYGPTEWTTSFGAEEYTLLEGSRLSDWDSGVVSAIELQEIKSWSFNDLVHWTPLYSTGTFAVHWDSRLLYSDHSKSELAEDITIGGFHYLDLDDNARWDTVSARMFTRDSSARKLTFRKWNFVEEFTAPMGVSTRPAFTVTASDRHWEYRIDDVNNRIEFNQSPLLAVGKYITPLDENEIRANWESGGNGDDDGKFIFLKHFPVLQGDVKVVSIDPGGVVTELTQVDRLWDSLAADTDFAVDRDQGVIQLGGYEAPTLVLADDIDDTVTEVPVLMGEDDFATWPDGGIFEIGTEKIKYRGKGYRKFLNCERGHLATAAAAHTQYDEIAHLSTGAAVDPADEVWITYVATPRVEYEISGHAVRTANGSWLNVHPLSAIEPRRIVQIDSVDQNIASIVLEADAPLVGGSLYGPIYYGTHVVRLTATAYNTLGQPVDDVDITIEIVNGPGLVGGGPTFTDTSNLQGQIYTLFSTSGSLDGIEMEAIPTHIGPDTEFAVADLKGIPDADSLWIYQVVKNDPIAGTVGIEVNAANPPTGGWSAPGALYNELSQFLIRMQHTDQFGRPPKMSIENYDLSVDDMSQIIVRDSGGTIRRYNILWAVRTQDALGAQAMRFGVDNATDPGLDGSEIIWILGPKDLEYVDGLGTRVILYKWYDAGEYEHPVTGVAASVPAPVAAPIHPDVVAANLVTVSGYNFPVGSKSDPRENVAGYVLIGPGRTELRATAVDPYSGTLIESNHIFLSLELPPQLVGVDSTGVLPIPSGWRLPTASYNLGAGMGGANFLTINPAAASINRFTLTGVV